MSHDPIEQGRLEITVSGGTWTVVFDGKECLSTVHRGQVRRECARLFLLHSVRRNKHGGELTKYRLRTAPRWLEDRLSTAIDVHLDALAAQAEDRAESRTLMRQPSSLQRHWRPG